MLNLDKLLLYQDGQRIDDFVKIRAVPQCLFKIGIRYRLEMGQCLQQLAIKCPT